METILALLQNQFSEAFQCSETLFTIHHSPLTKVNYIRHLNSFFALIKTDTRLSASHVSLYVALFQYWNYNRFNNPFSIYRENIMQLSKLSKNTYHKCVKELHEAKYIYYHPSPSKFQAVRISIVRLDQEEEPTTRYHQLDLFSGLKNETGRVAISRPASTNNGTDTVSNLGHIIKPNIKTERNTRSSDFLEEAEIHAKKTASSHVSNSIHDTERSRSAVQPTLSEVEEWFTNHTYPKSEATKFYNHYKALGWKIQGKTPIEDWKPLVEKWMTNAKKWETPTEPKSVRPQLKEKANEVQYLYECFLENKKIFNQITEQHFEQLQLQLTENIMQHAWQQRTNQVSGTNQYSLNQLWQAYLSGNKEDPLIKKDTPSLISLAKRIAVVQHFQELQQSGTNNITIKTNNNEH